MFFSIYKSIENSRTHLLSNFFSLLFLLYAVCFINAICQSLFYWIIKSYTHRFFVSTIEVSSSDANCTQFISIIPNCFAFVCLIHTGCNIHLFYLTLSAFVSIGKRDTFRNCNHRDFKFPYPVICFVFFSLFISSIFYFVVSAAREYKIYSVFGRPMILFHAIFIRVGSSWWQFYFVTRAFPRHL